MELAATISSPGYKTTLQKERPAAADTWHIHIKGLVQGVGFRPLVYALAKTAHINGEVRNDRDGLHISLNSSQSEAEEFLDQILYNAPPLSQITSCQLHPSASVMFEDFSICTQSKSIETNLWIPPDFALCEACQSEILDPQNRRFNYPFITCTQCGPRFSILKQIPFERHLTTMQAFELCPVCRKEYEDPSNRRFFAQTISCPDCGVVLLVARNGEMVPEKNSAIVLSEMISCLLQGKIVAVKGIGGYLLLTDATRSESIERLRQRKHRPAKPLAVMFPSMEELLNHTTLKDIEKEALSSKEVPIVLIPLHDKLSALVATDSIAPNLNTLGVMLPYAPILQLIAAGFKKPLVATSANISGSPILYTEAQALEHLSEIADLIVGNNREIVLPQDDSVLRFSEKQEVPIWLRRSRGVAPAFPFYTPQKKETVLGFGALLKSSFALSHTGQICISPYLGNTDGYDAQQTYLHTQEKLLTCLEAKPDALVCDLHPQYFSTIQAKEKAEKEQLYLFMVQHHKAHFAAVLAENNLLDSKQPVLGVIWDGTGIGEDGQLWGGEFFTYEEGQIIRRYYFDYFPQLLGDKMATEPRLSALSVLQDCWPAYEPLKEKFTETEWSLYQKMLDNHNGIQTSSVGRVFDAAASLLLGIDKQSYEGEAAMRLEAVANEWCRNHSYDVGESYFTEGAHYNRIPVASFIQGILRDLRKGADRDFIAAKFHFSLAHLIEIISNHLQVTEMVCSGGVFQNALLVDLILERFAGKKKVHFHKHLSPNDENISFGQLVAYDRDLYKKENNSITITNQ